MWRRGRGGERGQLCSLRPLLLCDHSTLKHTQPRRRAHVCELVEKADKSQSLTSFIQFLSHHRFDNVFVSSRPRVSSPCIFVPLAHVHDLLESTLLFFLSSIDTRFGTLSISTCQRIRRTYRNSTRHHRCARRVPATCYTLTWIRRGTLFVPRFCDGRVENGVSCIEVLVAE